MRSTDETKRQAREALDRAKLEHQSIKEQTQAVRAEAVQLRYLLQENNLARRLRKAMQLRWGDA